MWNNFSPCPNFVCFNHAPTLPQIIGVLPQPCPNHASVDYQITEEFKHENRLQWTYPRDTRLATAPVHLPAHWQLVKFSISESFSHNIFQHGSESFPGKMCLQSSLQTFCRKHWLLVPCLLMCWTLFTTLLYAVSRFPIHTHMCSSLRLPQEDRNLSHIVLFHCLMLIV